MFHSGKRKNERQMTLWIWSISLAVYAIGLVTVWQCDFLRFSHYSVESLQKEKQENEKRNAELRKNMQTQKKKAPEEELKKIMDRKEKKQTEELRRQIADVEEVIEKMDERTEELKEIYQARRIPEWEAYERIFAIVENFHRNNLFTGMQSVRMMQKTASELKRKLNSLDQEEAPPVFPNELQTLKQYSLEFREKDTAMLENTQQIASATWRAMEMERLIQLLLKADAENIAPGKDVYDISVMNTPPEMPDADATLNELEQYLAGMQEQIETANAELNAYTNAIRNMESVDHVLDSESIRHFSNDLRKELDRKGVGLEDKVQRAMRKAENELKRLENTRAVSEETAESFQKRLDTLLDEDMRAVYRLYLKDYEDLFRKLDAVSEKANFAMSQAKRAEETFREKMSDEDFVSAGKYADFIQQAAQDVVNAVKEYMESVDIDSLLKKLMENTARQSADAATQINRQLNRLAEQNTGDDASADLADAVAGMRQDVADTLRKNTDAIATNDPLSAWEQEQHLEQLQSAMKNNASGSRQGGSQQGAQRDAQGNSGGGQGQSGGMSQQEFMNMMERMESLQDMTTSLQNRAQSVAKGAGLNLPLSAQRLFTALQNRALQRNGMSGGQMGLPGQMGALSEMNRQGRMGAGAQRQGQGQGRGQGRNGLGGDGDGPQGPGRGNQQGQGGNSGFGISRGTFDFPSGLRPTGRVGELIGASAGKTGADPGIIAESIPGRRFSADSKRTGLVFLDSWYVIGPWESNGAEFSQHMIQEPENHIDLDATYYGKVDPVTGKPIKLRWHYIQTDTICVRPPMKMEDAYYYAYTDVFCEEAIDVIALIGTDDAGKIWVNNQVVWEDDGLSTWALTEGILNVHFNKGRNSILIAVQNGPDECQFSFAIVATAHSDL